MKIAILNYYQAGRGAESFVEEFVSRLKKFHTIIPVIGTQKTASNRDPITIPQRFFLDRDSIGVGLWTLKNLKTITKASPDIVIPTNGGWQALIISLYCRLKKITMVVIGQSGPGWDDRWNLFTKPHVFVALTERQKKWAEKTTPWPDHKIVKIPNGVDTKKFNPKGRQVNLALQKPIILIVAATSPYKRVEQGIEAVSRLSRGSLLLLGKGPLDERVDKLGYRLLGKSRYKRLTVPFSKIPNYYRSADLFTLCSASTEAFGIVYIEAMASGLPIVATDDSSRREIIGKAGEYVKNPDNISKYTRALKQALEKKWGDTPLSQVEKFSWNSTARKYNELFKTIV